MNADERVLQLIADVMDPADIVTDPDIMGSYRTDRSTGAEAGWPRAVVFPRSTEEVSAVMRIAYDNSIPVVPRGAGSGLTGGSHAIDGCLVVCVERMRDVLGVNVADGYVETQPGIFNTQLRDQVSEFGLWYAPDPASKDFCSIGGNVNTNAGGLCCVKYGVTRDAVLGLEVVLADGRITRLGRRTVKGVAGYDLAGLMVGSEGTLGIVTMARLRLRPLPPVATTAIAIFHDVSAAGRAVESIMRTTTPSLLEIMDRTTMCAVEQWRPSGLPTRAGALLLAQSDLPGSAGEQEADRILQACQTHGADETYRSEDPDQSEALLGARRMAIPALEMMGDWLLDDIAVPRSRLAEAMAGIEKISERRSVTIGTFGHAGDGNLHPTIVVPRGDEDAAVRAMAAFDDLLDLALQVGGTVTGEHGIGLLKRAALADELDEASRDLHVRIKAAWDPRGILNPGKSLARW